MLTRKMGSLFLLFFLIHSNIIVAEGRPDKKKSALETYGNFETMGVIADVPPNYTVDKIGRVKCYIKNGKKWKSVHDLVQVGNNNWFATSIFYLKPGTTYKVRVEFHDIDGKTIQTLEANGSTRKDITIPEPKISIYVSPKGNDSNSGNINAPFQTLKKAIASAKAGTTIFLRNGIYYEGQMEFSSNGTETDPIVVRSFKKERVILDGSDPALIDANGWKDEGEGIYSHAYKGTTFCASVEHKTSGKWIRLFLAKSLESLRSRTIEIPKDKRSFAGFNVKGAIFTDGKRAYITLPEPIERYRIHVSRFTRCMVLENRRYLYFDGLEIRNYGKGRFGAAAFAENTSNMLWQNCRIYNCNSGIWVKKSCFNNTFQDCEYYDNLASFSWQLFYKTLLGETGAGFVYVAGEYYGRGLVIRRNRISNVFDGGAIVPHYAIRGRTSETDFYQNRIIDVGDDCFEVDGYSRNVRIFDNFMNKSLSGISIAQALDGPTFILYNVIANSGVCQATREGLYKGYPFKTNGGPEPEVGSGEVFFYHNTSYTKDPDSQAIRIQYAKWKKITFRNNIWCGIAKGFVSWQKPLSPMDFDYDNLYVYSGGPLLHYKKMWKPEVKASNLTELRKHSPYLKHGFSLNPKFADPGKNDFRLKEDSPLIDKGIRIPGINDNRIMGKAPDLGCFEFVSK